MNQDFKARLHQGDLLIGTIISLATPEVAEIMSLAGFDWLFARTDQSPESVLRRFLGNRRRRG